MTATRTRKPTKAQIKAQAIAEKNAARAAYLAPIYAAIAEGRAFLTTFKGEFRVQSYNDETGWAIVGEGRGMFDQQSFMICADRIQIRPSA